MSFKSQATPLYVVRVGTKRFLKKLSEPLRIELLWAGDLNTALPQSRIPVWGPQLVRASQCSHFGHSNSLEDFDRVPIYRRCGESVLVG